MFCSVLFRTNQSVQAGLGTHLRGPRSKETHLSHETGVGRLVCEKWFRELRRSLRESGGGGRGRRTQQATTSDSIPYVWFMTS